MNFPKLVPVHSGPVVFTMMLAVMPAFVASATSTNATSEDLDELEGSIAIDGSSTVGPLTAAVAEEFLEVAPGVGITIDFSGTGGGFDRFCAGDVDIANASREIRPGEVGACEDAGYDWYRFRVAYDGITLIVNDENDFVDCLTIDQLHRLWKPDSDVMQWSDLNPAWPEETIHLYGPGTDSGTFDYFTEVINGEAGASRTDFQPSEDDNVIVQGVAYDRMALGYLGFAFYHENQEALTALAIDNGNGCVAPTRETIANGRYAPLSRPLFVYVRDDALARPEVQAFMRFYLAHAGELARDVGYIGLPDDVIAGMQAKLSGAVAGTLPPGHATDMATPAG